MSFWDAGAWAGGSGCLTLRGKTRRTKLAGHISIDPVMADGAAAAGRTGPGFGDRGGAESMSPAMIDENSQDRAADLEGADILRFGRATGVSVEYAGDRIIVSLNTNKENLTSQVSSVTPSWGAFDRRTGH